MKYFLTTQDTSHGRYYLFKCNYRKKGKVCSKYVYLGSEEIALKILSDINTKKPHNERLLSFSGEMILSKSLQLIKFKNLINKIITNGAELDVGRFIEMIVIERALNEYSKWRLAREAHINSIFFLDSGIPHEKFTEANIYNYMDYIYPDLDRIQVMIVNQLLTIKTLRMDELIIDGTSVYCFGSDEEDELEFEEERHERVKRLRGYSRDKRPDLPQINLILGINRDYIPLLFETFSGNTPDVTMFQKTLKKIQTQYPMLLETIRNKYIVFDKGNNNPANFKDLDAICDKWGVQFVASVRPSMLKDQLLALQLEELPEIYSQKKTKLKGKTIRLALYERERTVLLYTNEAVARKKQGTLVKVLDKIQEKANELNQNRMDLQEKLNSMRKFLRKRHLIRCFDLQIESNMLKCTPIAEKITRKMDLFGKFAIITTDFHLDAASIIRIYKSCSVVEHEFHLLKSVFQMHPVFHRKPDRIKVHFALVIWGIMAFAILRNRLIQKKLEFSFEQLKALIKKGYLSMGDYIYPGHKSFRIQRTLNIAPDLKKILKNLGLKFDYFDIKVLPTPKNDTAKKTERRGEV